MADNVVNLNRFRKRKARADKAKQAEINRIRHGRTGAQKARELADQQRAAQVLDGKRLEPDEAAVAEEPEAGATPTSPD